MEQGSGGRWQAQHGSEPILQSWWRQAVRGKVDRFVILIDAGRWWRYGVDGLGRLFDLLPARVYRAAVLIQMQAE